MLIEKSVNAVNVKNCSCIALTFDDDTDGFNKSAFNYHLWPHPNWLDATRNTITAKTL